MDSIAVIILLGVVAVLMLIIIVFMVAKNANGGMREYDERQKIAQGKAAKAGFFTIIAYIFIAGLFDAINEVVWAPFIIEGFIGIMLGLCVYASVCIFMDAYVALRVKPGRMLLLIGGICLMNAGICLPYFFDGGFVTDGMLNLHSMNLICVISLLIIFLELLLKMYLNKLEEARAE